MATIRISCVIIISMTNRSCDTTERLYDFSYCYFSGMTRQANKSRAVQISAKRMIRNFLLYAGRHGSRITRMLDRQNEHRLVDICNFLILTYLANAFFYL